MPLTALLLLSALAACSNGTPSTVEDGAEPAAAVTEPPGADVDAGTISFELRTPGGVSFDKFNYAVTGPHFATAGSIDVSNSTTVSARIDGIPAASGYSVTLSGNSLGSPQAQCSGSAAFEVQPRTVISVPVAIECHLTPSVEPLAGGRPAPLPQSVSWLCGLALLALGSGQARLRSPQKTSK